MPLRSKQQHQNHDVIKVDIFWFTSHEGRVGSAPSARAKEAALASQKDGLRGRETTYSYTQRSPGTGPVREERLFTFPTFFCPLLYNLLVRSLTARLSLQRPRNSSGVFLFKTFLRSPHHYLFTSLSYLPFCSFLHSFILSKLPNDLMIRPPVSHKAAARIQALKRGNEGRALAARRREERDAATRIQGRVRIRKAR